MEKTSPIYVAGHKGLIGSACVRQLRSAGYQNIITADRQELDLTDHTAVRRFFDAVRPEYVILAAGKVGGIIQNNTCPADFINVNLAIQLNVLQASHRIDIQKLILFGSSCMYPRECPQPMAETALFSGYPEPTSMAYAVSKMAGMQMCLAYNRQYGGTRFIPVIPNSAYGPNDDVDPQSSHVLSALIRRFHEAKQQHLPRVTLWGSGAPRREFVYADDIADACITLLNKDLSHVDLPLNIGTGTDISIKELAERIAEVVGFTGDLEFDISKPDGAPRKLLDSSRMLGLGWLPKIELSDGLRSTYQWYVQNMLVTGDPL